MSATSVVLTLKVETDFSMIASGGSSFLKTGADRSPTLWFLRYLSKTALIQNSRSGLSFRSVHVLGAFGLAGSYTPYFVVGRMLMLPLATIGRKGSNYDLNSWYFVLCWFILFVNVTCTSKMSFFLKNWTYSRNLWIVIGSS